MIKRTDQIINEWVLQRLNKTPNIVNIIKGRNRKLEFLRYVIRNSEKYATIHLIIQGKIQS